MRLQVDFAAPVWSVLPAAGDEVAWLDAEGAHAERFHPDRRGEARRRAEVALDQRRVGIATSLYFRPPGLPASGVLHLTLADVPLPGDRFTASEFVPGDVDPDFAPTVSEFETNASPHGYRIAYLSEHRYPDGGRMAGISYGLQFPGAVVTVFSELADPETIGLMQLHADTVVDALEVVA